MADLVVEMFDDTLASSVDALVYTRGQEFTKQKNDTGIGKVVFLDSDPALLLAAPQMFVNFTYKGSLDFTMLIERIDPKPLQQGEEHDQQTDVTGRGTAAMLERALVYPVLGPGNFPAEVDRFFGWTSPFFDYSGYPDATKVCTVGEAITGWAGGAAPWDASFPSYGAEVLWASDGTITDAGVGHCYGWQVFNVGITIPAKVFCAADNTAQLFIDGVQLIHTGFDVGRSFEQQFDLSAGLHLISWQCENLPGVSDNPAGIAYAVWGTDVNGALTGEVTTSTATGSPACQIAEYAADPPPMPLGMVLNIVLDEAAARGVKGFDLLTRTFTDTLDTDGTTWPDVNISTRVGNDLLAFFKEQAQTYIDFDFTPGTLELNAWIKGNQGL